MSRGDLTPWINEGSLRVRYAEEDGKLIRHLNQPDRDLIVDQIADERNHFPDQPFLGGYKVASIPLVDYERVKGKYPALFDGRGADMELKTKELVAFSHDPEMAEFRIKRA